MDGVLGWYFAAVEIGLAELRQEPFGADEPPLHGMAPERDAELARLAHANRSSPHGRRVACSVELAVAAAAHRALIGSSRPQIDPQRGTAEVELIQGPDRACQSRPCEERQGSWHALRCSSDHSVDDLKGIALWSVVYW